MAAEFSKTYGPLAKVEQTPADSLQELAALVTPVDSAALGRSGGRAVELGTARACRDTATGGGLTLG